MKKRILLSKLPSRYERLSGQSYLSNAPLRNSILSFSQSTSFLDVVDAGVRLKKITILHDLYKNSYILLIPKTSVILYFALFAKIVSDKMSVSPLFPYHYFYVLNDF